MWGLARQRTGGPYTNVPGLIAAWVACVMLSLGIEAAQFFTVTRTPSTSDLLANAFGAAVGAILALAWGQGLDRLLNTLLRANQTPPPARSTSLATAMTLAGCALLLAVWAGVFTSTWSDAGLAWNRLQSVQALPFLRHQAADIFLAAASTALAALAFAPLGASAWFLGLWSNRRWRGRAGRVALVGAATAFSLESLKIFLPAKTPDTGNVVIAALAMICAYGLAPLVSQALSGAWPHRPSGEASNPTGSMRERHRPPETGGGAGADAGAGAGGTMVVKFLACLCAVAAAALVSHYPLAPLALGAALLCYAGLLIRFPTIWLLVIPALLPVLDLAPWTGWHYIDEFDAFVLVTLAVGLWRLPGKPSHTGSSSMIAWLALAGFCASFLLSAVYGAMPFAQPDANALGNPYSPYSGLSMAKAMVLAGGLALMLGRHNAAGHDWKPMLAAGMVAGLVGASGSVVVERLAYASLADFAAPYRAIGLFSTMQTGGAHLDAYLLFALPVAAVVGLHGRRRWQRVLGVVALVLGTYAVTVTFSRASIAALGLEALVLAASAAWFASRRTSTGSTGQALTLASLALLVAVVAPGVLGTFMQNRIATTGADMQTRTSHWRDSYAMMTDDLHTTLFGMGVGSFPRTYQMLGPESLRPAAHQFTTESGNTFLRVGNGATLYVEQIVPVIPRETYTVKLRARGRGQDSTVHVLLCDRTLLQGYGCQSATFSWTGEPDVWKSFEATLNAGTVGENPLRTSKLSLQNASRTASVDLDNIALLDQGGVDRLENGDFQSGADRWHFSSPFNHLPWHIKNVWLEVLFNQGWVGLLLFSALIASTTIRLSRRLLHGDVTATALLTSLLGLLVVGAFDSILDAPRLVLMVTLALATSVIVCQRPTRHPSTAVSPMQGPAPPMHPATTTTAPSRLRPVRGPAQTALAGIGGRSWRSIALHVLVLAVLIAVLTRLPIVPYNVRELLNPYHPVAAPVLLAIAVFWVFGFPAWSVRWLAAGRSRFVALPPAIVLYGLVGWVSLRYAVLPESIHDVVGSPVLGWPWDTEVMARLTTLLSTIGTPLMAGALLVTALNAERVGSTPVWLALFVALLFPVQYAVIVTWAGTDNLTELMASNASIGAFALLFLYMLVVATVGSMLAALRHRGGHTRIAVAAASLALSLPLGYLLLRSGTEPVVIKQGQVFSAMQFLFSTDRTQYASGINLLARFAVFHVLFVGMVAWTQSVFWLPMADKRPTGKKADDGRANHQEKPAS
ncbi:MAG: VanZ family protein [Rhodoferax sp.]|nr:VanZ family protein [Rhodoferax sp.]